MSIEIPGFRREAALRELEQIVRDFSRAEPSTAEWQNAAEKIVDVLMLQNLCEALDESDLAPYLKEIQKASPLVAESLVREVVEGRMTREEVLGVVKRMAQKNFIATDRNPILKSFLDGNLSHFQGKG